MVNLNDLETMLNALNSEDAKSNLVYDFVRDIGNELPLEIVENSFEHFKETENYKTAINLMRNYDSEKFQDEIIEMIDEVGEDNPKEALSLAESVYFYKDKEKLCRQIIKNYEKNEGFFTAAKFAEEHKLYREAIDLYKKADCFIQALYLKKFIDSEEELEEVTLKASEEHIKKGRYEDAGDLLFQLGLKEKAKEMYKSALNQLEFYKFNHLDSARIHEKLGERQAAITMYSFAGEYDTAANMYLSMGKIDDAINIYADSFNKAKAAALAIEHGKIDRALELYLLSNKLQAARFAEEHGMIEKSIEIYEENNYISEAAKVAEEHGMIEKSIEIYEENNYISKAAKVAEEHGIEEKAKELWNQSMTDAEESTNIECALKIAKKLGLQNKIEAYTKIIDLKDQIRKENKAYEEDYPRPF